MPIVDCGSGRADYAWLETITLVYREYPTITNRQKLSLRNNKSYTKWLQLECTILRSLSHEPLILSGSVITVIAELIDGLVTHERG